MLDVNKQHTEFGIDPDVKVSITGEDIMKGRDTIIDRAIELLLAKADSIEAASKSKISSAGLAY